jgi:hypothetical protein
MKEYIYKDGKVTEVTHPDPETKPEFLSKTALLDHAVSQLGSADKVIEVLEEAEKNKLVNNWPQS